MPKFLGSNILPSREDYLLQEYKYTFELEVFYYIYGSFSGEGVLIWQK
jgi:hypothetical protein